MKEQDQVEYDLMMELDGLESLKEEMEELRVSSLSEIEARIGELNGKLDELQRGR
jgi:hypothetical protein